MRRPLRKRKCKHCQTLFDLDPRSATRQRYCAQPTCRQASKAASQRRWLQKPGNRDRSIYCLQLGGAKPPP